MESRVKHREEIAGWLAASCFSIRTHHGRGLGRGVACCPPPRTYDFVAQRLLFELAFSPQKLSVILGGLSMLRRTSNEHAGCDTHRTNDTPDSSLPYFSAAQPLPVP